MLAIIILGFIILLIISAFLFNKKPVTDNSKIASKTKKIFAITALGVFIMLIISALMSDGVRSFYCISDDKCVTIWKRGNGEVLLMSGKYKSRKIPLDNYIKITNMKYSFIVTLFIDNRLLIDVDENATVIKQATNSLMELYKDNKVLNDSMYTYFDGKYNRYKKEVDYISVNIKENYATDKSGKKLK